VLIFSCDKQGLLVPCSECIDKEPSQVILLAKINPFSESNTKAKVILYEGNIEDSIIVGRYSSESSPISLTVNINKNYTITATYYRYGITYTAVDSALPRVRFLKNKCKDPCYIVYDNQADLRIKYY
jgi:hypothetical protein